VFFECFVGVWAAGPHDHKITIITTAKIIQSIAFQPRKKKRQRDIVQIS